MGYYANVMAKLWGIKAHIWRIWNSSQKEYINICSGLSLEHMWNFISLFFFQIKECPPGFWNCWPHSRWYGSSRQRNNEKNQEVLLNYWTTESKKNRILVQLALIWSLVPVLICKHNISISSVGAKRQTLRCLVTDWCVTSLNLESCTLLPNPSCSEWPTLSRYHICIMRT